jgi:hypothetical protein
VGLSPSLPLPLPLPLPLAKQDREKLFSSRVPIPSVVNLKRLELYSGNLKTKAKAVQKATTITTHASRGTRSGSRSRSGRSILAPFDCVSPSLGALSPNQRSCASVLILALPVFFLPSADYKEALESLFHFFTYPHPYPRLY